MVQFKQIHVFAVQDQFAIASLLWPMLAPYILALPSPTAGFQEGCPVHQLEFKEYNEVIDHSIERRHSRVRS